MIATVPLTIIADDREKSPYTFAGCGEVYVVRQRLLTGDYSLPFRTGEVAVSRKSLADLYGTCLDDARRKRFADELCRMAAMRDAGGAALVLVEETPWLADPPQGFTREHRSHVLRLIDGWREGVAWRYCEGRRDAEVAAYAWLLAARERLEIAAAD